LTFKVREAKELLKVTPNVTEFSKTLHEDIEAPDPTTEQVPEPETKLPGEGTVTEIDPVLNYPLARTNVIDKVTGVALTVFGDAEAEKLAIVNVAPKA
jgi:hypothetical protein